MHVFTLTLALGFMVVATSNSFAGHKEGIYCPHGFQEAPKHHWLCESPRAGHTKADGAMDGYDCNQPFMVYKK